MDLFYCSNIFYCSNTYYEFMFLPDLLSSLVSTVVSGSVGTVFWACGCSRLSCFFWWKGSRHQTHLSSCVFGIFREHLSHKSSAIVYSHLFLFPVFKWIFDKRVTTILHFLYAPLPAGVFAEFNVVFICIEWPTAQSVRVIDLLNLQIKFTLFPLFQLSCLF